MNWLRNEFYDQHHLNLKILKCTYGIFSWLNLCMRKLYSRLFDTLFVKILSFICLYFEICMKLACLYTIMVPSSPMHSKYSAIIFTFKEPSIDEKKLTLNNICRQNKQGVRLREKDLEMWEAHCFISSHALNTLHHGPWPLYHTVADILAFYDTFAHLISVHGAFIVTKTSCTNFCRVP